MRTTTIIPFTCAALLVAVGLLFYSAHTLLARWHRNSTDSTAVTPQCHWVVTDYMRRDKDRAMTQEIANREFYAALIQLHRCEYPYDPRNLFLPR